MEDIITGIDYMTFMGPEVTLVQQVKDSESGLREIRTRMPALAAAWIIQHSPENGQTVKSARIEFDGVLDVWGGSR